MIKIVFFIFLNLKVAFCFELECRFVEYPDGYNCVMMSNLMKNDRVTSVEGDHKENQNNSNVASLFILYSSRTRYVPFGACSKFDNLKQFDINGQKITEVTSEILDGCLNIVAFIVRNSRIKALDENLLKNVQLLEHFTLDNTLVEYLPENFFKYNKNLKRIFLSGNKLKVINVIFPSTLTMLRLFSNQCINDGHISTDSRSTPLIVLIDEIKNKCNNQTNQLSTTQKIDTANEQLIQLLEDKMNLLHDYLGSLRTSIAFSITRLMNLATVGQSQFELFYGPNYSLDISNIQGQLENLKNIHETIETRFNEAILMCRQLEDELENVETLRKTNDNFNEENNTVENFMILILCVQVMIIAFIVFKTVFLFKHSS